MINVLVADDSALMRRIDCDIINSLQDFCVADIAFDETSLLKKLRENAFDLLVMNASLDSSGDGHFMDAMKALKLDTAFVVICYPLFEDKNLVSRAYGDAAGLIVRPFHMKPEERDDYRKELSKAVSNAAGKIKFTGTSMRQTEDEAPKKDEKDSNSANQRGQELFNLAFKPTVRAASEIAKRRKPVSNGPFQLVVLACSTGGPQALHKVIPLITKDIPVPFVIVQHMPYGFTKPLAEGLSEKSHLMVKEAEDGEVLLKNTIYIAPGGRHLEIINDSHGALAAKVYDGAAVNSLKPCADVTIRSVADCQVNNILCVVLTGMGMDGTTGIAELSSVKNTFVISQDEESSVVYGMPKAVKDTGLSNEVEPLGNIAQSIMKKLGVL